MSHRNSKRIQAGSSGNTAPFRIAVADDDDTRTNVSTTWSEVLTSSNDPYWSSISTAPPMPTQPVSALNPPPRPAKSRARSLDRRNPTSSHPAPVDTANSPKGPDNRNIYYSRLGDSSGTSPTTLSPPRPARSEHRSNTLQRQNNPQAPKSTIPFETLERAGTASRNARGSSKDRENATALFGSAASRGLSSDRDPATSLYGTTTRNQGNATSLYGTTARNQGNAGISSYGTTSRPADPLYGTATTTTDRNQNTTTGTSLYGSASRSTKSSNTDPSLYSTTARSTERYPSTGRFPSTTRTGSRPRPSADDDDARTIVGVTALSPKFLDDSNNNADPFWSVPADDARKSVVNDYIAGSIGRSVTTANYFNSPTRSTGDSSSSSRPRPPSTAASPAKQVQRDSIWADRLPGAPDLRRLSAMSVTELAIIAGNSSKPKNNPPVRSNSERTLFSRSGTMDRKPVKEGLEPAGLFGVGVRPRGISHRTKIIAITAVVSLMLAIALTLTLVFTAGKNAGGSDGNGAGATPSPNATGPSGGNGSGGGYAATMPFITREAATGALYEGTKPFRFVSFNVPDLNGIIDRAGGTWIPPNKFETDDALLSIQQMQGLVIRIYCMGFGAAPRHYQGVGVYGEEAFKSLDYVLMRAGQLGVRVIVPLIDMWNWGAGGMYTFANIVTPGKYGSVKAAQQGFFTDRALINAFKDFLTYTINRVNTESGIRYGDDPAVFGWQTGNEMGGWETDYGAGGGFLVPGAWTVEIAQHLKTTLKIKQLMMDGTLGGFQGAKWAAEALSSDLIDVISNHYYGSSTVGGSGNDYVTSVERDGKTAARNKKSLVVTEMGLVADPNVEYTYFSYIADASRSFTPGTQNVAGSLYWSLRFHARDGGFYTHTEDAAKGHYSYHWPGSNTTATNVPANSYEFMGRMYAASTMAATGTAATKWPAPGKPSVLSVSAAALVRIVGGVGAVRYEVQRKVGDAGQWTDVGAVDAMVVYDRVASVTDAAAAAGAVWRVRGIGRGGDPGEWSDAVGRSG
ncbi:glycoside hydrolase superfamily [Cladochytrium replicatum]|nr:glycoside hydrolase superfamily [Cladochytrium replicatum]